MIWLTRTMIDPALPLSKSARIEIMRIAKTRCVSDRLTRIPLLLIILASFTVFHILPPAVDVLFGFKSDWREMIAFAISGLVFGGLMSLIFPYWLSLIVHDELRLRGFDVCVKCGYWLRNLDDEITKCPECGADRRPMPEPKP